MREEMRNVLEAKKEEPAPEGGFRESLEDFVLIAQRLSGVCDSAEHMVEVAKNALKDDSALRFLINVMKVKSK